MGKSKLFTPQPFPNIPNLPVEAEAVTSGSALRGTGPAPSAVVAPTLWGTYDPTANYCDVWRWIAIENSWVQENDG